MTNTTDLNQQSCDVCAGGGVVMTRAEAHEKMPQLHSDWMLDAETSKLTREMTFKGFAKPVYHANLAAFLGDKEGHHPDIQFGWGYCKITFTSHELGGLSPNDFICAAKFDALVG
ncbi:4a-hydroxytetrahydrobiopterin dehydratase [uncultured Litoreibacter sp.]|uniref:4a-hydroxytetrahydrobiopterin dehydratase n=1 Tax=uncultured Litoreibacter sp. TaxID=1392394 RepID=UPI0026276D54|nr:4a-hydroxytetrahydrobiopterin dehydratase [uncultured Litoreibacter sp.]